MIDPLALVRAAVTLTGAIVLGSGFLVWYAKDARAKAGGTLWRHRVALMNLVAAGLGVVTTALLVNGTAATAAQAPSIFSLNFKVLQVFVSQTWSGSVLLAVFWCAVATLLAAGVAFLLRARPDVGDMFSLAAAGLAGLGLVAISLASHPVSVDPAWAGIAMSVVHRIALGLWFGGLPALILLIGLGPVSGDTGRLAVLILARFSTIAVASVSALLVSGIILTYFIVGNFASIIGTVYGYWLVAKLLALGGVLYIAYGLRHHLLPRLESDANEAGLADYAKRVKVETGLAVLILVFASIMGNSAPPEHEDIYWPLPFRFSLRAAWGEPWVPTLVIGGTLLLIAGVTLAVLAWRGSRRPVNLEPKYGLALGTFTAIAGAALVFPAISVRAYPDSYLTPDVDFAVESIAHGLNKYEDNCAACHGVGGRGDGPAGKGLPVPPADLTAPHTALHTAGDMYWWVTHGIPESGMPGFADSLTPEDRWDVINFLQDFTLGYQARIITPRIVPNQPWLGPPDLSVTNEQGETLRIRDYRRDLALLVVLAFGPADKARVEQLIAARDRLAKYKTKIVLIAPGPEGEPLRELASGKILIVDTDADAAAAAFGLLSRTLTNARTESVRVPKLSAEFLIDRSGYLRARWLPSEDTGADSWNDLDVLERQVTLLAQEPLRPPPVDHDH
jgi:putative copper export protein/mono/diheme cytochrome c family protein